MKIVFMGTPDFAVPTLEALICSKQHEVVGVVTQPDKPKGRGNVMQYSPVKETALKYGIPVYQPMKVREPEAVHTIREMKPDVAVVVAFGQILTKEILEMPPYGCINIHASLLPKYRGSAPIQRVILEGETETGLTAMFMDIGIDTGDMLKKVAVEIAPDETAESLHHKLAPLGGQLILDVLSEVEQGTLVREKQDDSQATSAPQLRKETGLIHWNRPAIEIERLIRGLNPWPSAYTMLDQKVLKIWDAQVWQEEADVLCGTIWDVRKNGMAVQTGQGSLWIRRVQLEGKKQMDAAAFLRGYPRKPGDRFGL
jgi:methionyl-tRNA formyltransferase